MWTGKVPREIYIEYLLTLHLPPFIFILLYFHALMAKLPASRCVASMSSSALRLRMNQRCKTHRARVLTALMSFTSACALRLTLPSNICNANRTPDIVKAYRTVARMFSRGNQMAREYARAQANDDGVVTGSDTPSEANGKLNIKAS